MRTTTDPNDPRLTRENDTSPTPQAEVYLVLSAEERAKGFTRPLRFSYTHVGIRPTHPTRDLTDDEKAQYASFGYVQFEKYPESEAPLTGRFWTQEQLDSGCGKTTKMGFPLAETYARDPKFYGGTYCVHCRMHRPVEEFVWEGTDERVGS